MTDEKRHKPPPTRKGDPTWDDPAESSRFLAAAEEAGASDDPQDFERAFKRVVPRRDKAQKPSR